MTKNHPNSLENHANLDKTHDRLNDFFIKIKG